MRPTKVSRRVGEPYPDVCEGTEVVRPKRESKRPWHGRIKYRLLGLFTVSVMEGVVEPKEGMHWWVRPFVTWKWQDD